MSCAVIGDSIAAGTGAELPECVTRAVVGAGSASIVAMARAARTVVVSMGSNDGPHFKHTDTNMVAVRSRVPGARFIWIEPARKVPGHIVRTAAARFGDTVVTFKAGRDNLHPQSYKALARDVRAAMGVH